MSAIGTSTPRRCTATKPEWGGIRDSGLDRSEVFITSKLNNGFHRPDDARRAFDGTLEALGSDYVDLFLIHWPLPTLYGGDFVSTWLTLDRVLPRRPGPLHRSLKLSGRARAWCRKATSYRPSTRSRCIRTCATRRLGGERRVWDRHRGVVAAREEQGSQRSDDRRDRQSSGKDACAGGASLAHSTRGRHLP